jgi:hypothetical protein
MSWVWVLVMIVSMMTIKKMTEKNIRNNINYLLDIFFFQHKKINMQGLSNIFF